MRIKTIHVGTNELPDVIRAGLGVTFAAPREHIEYCAEKGLVIREKIDPAIAGAAIPAPAIFDFMQRRCMGRTVAGSAIIDAAIAEIIDPAIIDSMRLSFRGPAVVDPKIIDPGYAVAYAAASGSALPHIIYASEEAAMTAMTDESECYEVIDCPPRWRDAIQVHQACGLLPPMSAGELAGLGEDILLHGMTMPRGVLRHRAETRGRRQGPVRHRPTAARRSLQA
jgi:hypothetical protein